VGDTSMTSLTHLISSFPPRISIVHLQASTLDCQASTRLHARDYLRPHNPVENVVKNHRPPSAQRAPPSRRPPSPAQGTRLRDPAAAEERPDSLPARARKVTAPHVSCPPPSPSNTRCSHKQGSPLRHAPPPCPSDTSGTAKADVEFVNADTASPPQQGWSWSSASPRCSPSRARLRS
jgi:hypothetical protein